MNLKFQPTRFNPNRSLENRAFILREIRHDYGNNQGVQCKFGSQ